MIEKGAKTAFKVTKRLSESYGIPLTIIGKSITVDSVQNEYKDLINNAEFITDTDLPRVSLVNHSKPGDMIVVPAGPGGEIFGPEKIAASLPDKDLIITIGS
jgi:hypothetical protein